MSLRMDWIDRIFTKLSLTYGRDFLAHWEGIGLQEVKDDWAHELRGFADHPEALAYALKNLPHAKPPTVMQFRELARKWRPANAGALPAPNMDREDARKRCADLLAKLKSGALKRSA